jgi:MFS family permease
VSDVKLAPWYKNISKSQWQALFAAQSGWMLDAMDFVIYLMAIPALQAEFGFGSTSAGLLATVTLLSSAVGGIFFGGLADSIGRKNSLNLSIIIFSFCSLGSATSQSFTQLMVWRTLLGFGMGGEWSAGAALVSETWPSKHRGKAIGIVQSGWALGYILAVALAAAILPAFGWRVLFAVGFLPALLTLWIRKFVKEPELWMTNVNRSRSSLFSGMAAIFKRPLSSITLRATLLSTAVMFGYWGLFSWVPTFLASPLEQGGAGLTLVKSAPLLRLRM